MTGRLDGRGVVVELLAAVAIFVLLVAYLVPASLGILARKVSR